MDEKDIRRMFPRYQQGNFKVNVKLVKEIAAMAAKKGCTPAQLALGWLVTLSKREDMPEIIPIPGATSADHVKENAKLVAGERYHPMGMKLTNM
ncbi:MAG: hypothetical protein Q9214_006127 [Letrouitia sp. 1 TL-2023]